MEKNHSYCSSNPKGWFGHGHSLRNPAVVTLDFDYFLPDGYNYIPKGTPHKQWETLDFGWWCWTDTRGNTRLAKY